MGNVQHVDVIRKHRAAAAAVPEEIAVSLQQIAENAKQGLLALSVGVGLEVLKAMMAEEVTAVVA